MSFHEAMRLVHERSDRSVEAAHKEAYDLYGDDPDLILGAFAAGTHPRQRTCDPAKLAETKLMAAESFSRLPVGNSAEDDRLR